MKVVVVEPINQAFKELLSNTDKDWKTYDTRPKNKAEFVSRLEGADIATSFSTKYDAEIFKACPDLKYLSIPAVGANYFVDMEAAKKYGVTIMNCPGYNADAVAEMAIGLGIMVARKVPGQQHELRGGLWHGENSHGFLISGKTIGIIGNGNVGKRIQELLSGWSNNFLVADSKTSSSDLDAIFKHSQIIFVCCPLNDHTRGMVNENRLESMQDNSIIINVARGAVISQSSLKNCLRSGRLYGAGLDVFENEPEYGADVSSEIREFYEMSNVFVSPHVAGNTLESSKNLARITYQNLCSAEEGTPVNIYK